MNKKISGNKAQIIMLDIIIKTLEKQNPLGKNIDYYGFISELNKLKIRLLEKPDTYLERYKND